MSAATGLLAVARLRMQQAVAARAWVVVPAGLLVGLAAARLVPGADLAARAALADRATIAAALVLVCVVIGCLAATQTGHDMSSGTARGLFTAPVPRALVHVAGTLGLGVLGAVLLLATVAAGIVGLELGGLGAGAREPLRAFEDVVPSGGARAVSSQPVATFPIALSPADVARGSLVVSMRPTVVLDPGPIQRRERTRMTLRGPGGVTSDVVDVEFAPGVAVVARLATERAVPGPATLEVARPQRGGGLLFRRGDLAVASGPRLFATNAFRAALVGAPLVLLVTALAAAAGARLGAPTALIVTLAVLALFAAQDVLRDALEHEPEAPAASGHQGHDHSGHAHHDGHNHHDHGGSAGNGPVTGLRGAARALVGGTLAVLPPEDAFDAAATLGSGRAVPRSALVRSVRAAWLPLALLLLAGALLLRGRDVLDE